MSLFVGRVSFKHLPDDVSSEAYVGLRDRCLALAVESGFGSLVFVFELGDELEPHAHFFFETMKSKTSVIKLLKKHFRLPERVSFREKNTMSIHICSSVYLFFLVSLFCFFIDFSVGLFVEDRGSGEARCLLPVHCEGGEGPRGGRGGVPVRGGPAHVGGVACGVPRQCCCPRRCP